MSEDWSRFEVEATVADYLAMYVRELLQQPYNKAEHNRRLLSLLSNRTRAAIEFKHANISAVLRDRGYPFVDGYKPRSNYQDLLSEVLSEQLAANPEIEALTRRTVDQPVLGVPNAVDLDAIMVPAPVPSVERKAWAERRNPVRTPIVGVNYLAREGANASLGSAGEACVMRVEHKRLWTAGHRALADRIEQVSTSRGDGLGYDILSFEEDGRERLIEVKTTRFGAMTPFFASRNEVAVSAEESEKYQLYRVFKFREKPPRIFTLPGSLRLSCQLDPVQFEATLR